MRDILTAGLPIPDLLETTPSTASVAALTNCDQSSVSRIDRHVSQLLRIQRGPEHLRWVAAPWNGPAVAQRHEANPLPQHWEGDQRTLELLGSRVLDLAVVEVQAVPMADAWSAVPLAHYPTGLRQAMAQEFAAGTPQQTCTDVALVRQELLEHPAIQALINQLRHGYHQAYGHLQTWRPGAASP